MFDWDVNIFIFEHGGFKIKVFDVNCHPACIGRGDGGFRKSFNCSNLFCWCAYFSSELDTIATSIPSDLP